MSFLGELRRRKMFQVAATYAVVAWLLIQIAGELEAPLNLPPWFTALVVALLGLLFPITLIISWAYNLTPEGLVRESETARTPRRGRTIEFVLLGLVVVAVGWLIYRVEFSADREISITGDVEVANNQISNGVLSSLLIVPFRDLSGDQGHHVLGIATELIYRLGRIPDLEVKELETSLNYRDSTMDAQTIGAEVGVDAILRGTLQAGVAGPRITFTLRRTSDGMELDNDLFDAESDGDAIAMRDQIATRVLRTLQPNLPDDAARIDEPTEDSEAREFYLLGKAAARSRTEADLNAARDYFESAIVRDPEFADAYAAIAWVETMLWEYVFTVPNETIAATEELAITAYELDPESQEVLLALAIVRSYQHRWDEAIDLIERAVAVNPGASYPHLWHALILDRSLDRAGAIVEMREAVRLDPQDANANRLLGRWLADSDDVSAETTAEAIRLLEASLEYNPQNPSVHEQFSEILFEAGREDEAVDVLIDAPNAPADELRAIASAGGGYLDVLARYLETKPVCYEPRMNAKFDSAEGFRCLEESVRSGFAAFSINAPWARAQPGYQGLIEALNLKDRL